MRIYTEDDLRAALHTEAARATPPSPGLLVAHEDATVMRRARRNVLAVAMAVAVAVVVSIALTQRGGNRAPSEVRFLPASYEQACATEPNVCRPGLTGAVPTALAHSLHLPRVAAGAACPVTRGSDYRGPFVFGQRYGAGPVSFILGDRGDPQQGTSVLGTPAQAGWLAAENVLLIDKSYRGPVAVRGVRLDGSGDVGIGAPDTSTYVEPPFGGDLNVHDGYRTPPAGIWVKTPGCYGFQVDGLGFTESIVINMTAPAPARSLSSSMGATGLEPVTFRA
jgi:hypothetical protein